MVQSFLAAASLDATAKVAVIAFSVAIPLLAALAMVNRQEAFRHRRTPSLSVTITQVIAQLAAFIGIVAGFWHIDWRAGGRIPRRWVRRRAGAFGGVLASRGKSGPVAGRRALTHGRDRDARRTWISAHHCAAHLPGASTQIADARRSGSYNVPSAPRGEERRMIAETAETPHLSVMGLLWK